MNLDDVIDHPQPFGMLGIAFGVLGVALFGVSRGDPFVIMIAGLVSGIGIAALAIQVGDQS